MEEETKKEKEITMEETDEREIKNKREFAVQTIDILRPHFMFNVLNQIKYQIKRNPEMAEEMVYDLANFCRGSLTVASMEEEAVLDEEIRAFKSYLRLECAMNKNMELELDLTNERGGRHMIVSPGSLQEFGAMLVKEEVRTTKEKRTLVVTDGLKEDQYYIHVEIKETGQVLVHPVLDIEVDTTFGEA